MKQNVRSSMFWLMKRVGIVSGATVIVGIGISTIIGGWSSLRLCNTLFVLGGIVIASGLPEVIAGKGRISDYNYQLARSAGHSTLEERTQTDYQELNTGYSKLTIRFISGILTIGVGILINKFG
jgi:hypothetical protein